MSASIEGVNGADLSRRLALGPANVRSQRATRFRGEDLAVRLADFSPSVAQGLQNAYTKLSGLVEGLGDAEKSAQHRALIDAIDVDEILETLRGMADGISLSKAPVRFRQVLHDLRGGSMFVLMATLQSIQMDESGRQEIEQVYFLTRDAMKVMRNCIVDLDTARRERDLQERDHDIRFLCQKWERASRVQPDGSRVEVRVNREQNTVVSQSCMELATLDRVVTNLVDNAARHTEDGKVYLHILFPEPNAESVRMVVANRVGSKQRAALSSVLETNAKALFGRFTTTGSGIGMGIVADFVAKAYGLPNSDAAIEGQYVGATLDDEFFYAWIHWPGIERNEVTA